MKRLMVMTLLAVSLLGATAQAATITWSAPQQSVNEAPFSLRSQIRAGSCPTASFCLFGTEYGSLQTTAGPTDSTPTLVFEDRRERFRDVSCPTASLCVAITSAGSIWASDAPATAASWKRVMQTEFALNAITCASPTLCMTGGVTSDGKGGVRIATDPLNGPWNEHSFSFLQPDPITGVACAVETSTVCHAVDGKGHQYTNVSNTPNTLGDWSFGSTFPQPASLTCPAVTKCFGVANNGDISATNEFNTTVFYNVPRGLPVGTYDIDCASPTLCVDVSSNGTARVSTNPGGAASTWKETLSVTGALGRVACVPGGTACATGTVGGTVKSSSDVSVASPVWGTSDAVDQLNGLTAVDCAAPSACMAVDSSGHIATTTNPQGGGGTWTSETAMASQFFAVECPTTGLCVGAGSDGNVVTVADPFGARTPTVRNVAGTATIRSASCPTAGLCVTGTNTGQIVSSTAPASAAWSAAQISDAQINALSCASASFCMAVDNAGRYFTTTNPTGAADAWVNRGIPDELTAVHTALTCPTASSCLAGDLRGGVWEAIYEEGDGEWRWEKLPNTGMPELRSSEISDVDCNTDLACVATSRSGRVVTWLLGDSFFEPETEEVDPSLILGIACPGTALCVAVDGSGRSFLGSLTRTKLTLIKAGAGSGTLTSDPAGLDCGNVCEMTYPKGRNVLINAASAPGSSQANWSGGETCALVATFCSLEMTGDITLTVTFKLLRTVTVTTTGPGLVISSPAGIKCPPTCSATFNSGTALGLAANAEDGAYLVGWEGACSGTTIDCALTLDADMSAKATFAPIPTTTPTPTGTEAPTASPTATGTATAAPGPSDTATPAGSPSATPTGTATPAPSATPTPPGPRCVVPRLKGKSLAKARQALKKANCRLGKAKRKKGVRGATVVGRQTRKPQALLPARTKVGVTLIAKKRR